MSNKRIIYDDLIKDELEHYLEIFILSIFGLFLYLIASLIIVFYVKNIFLLKSKPFIFILVHSITNLIELNINTNELYQVKCIFSYISYLAQFHLVISSINNFLMGKQIFKGDKDYSIKKLKYYEIIIPIIFFPYSIVFQNTEYINFFQYFSIIVLLLCLYEYVSNKINQIIKYLNESNNKDNIEIAYMEPEELNKIYILTKYIWSISFILILLFYIAKFFDILLRQIVNIHYLVYLILIIIKESLSFILFISLIVIIVIINISYDKGQIIQTDDDENSNIKKVSNKLEIEIDDLNIERKNKKDEYNNIEKLDNGKTEEDNEIGIENMDIKNGKENTDEEKLDDEDENLNINKLKETDELKIK